MRATGLCGLVALVLLAASIGIAATPNDPQPGQRIDLKVLLLSADGNEPGFAAWKAALDREGVPYDTLVAYNGQTKVATLTDDRLADYAADHAKYQAVILASGDLGRNFTNRNDTTSYLSALTDAEWTSLAKFERTFGIRRLSDATAPSPEHGLNVVNGLKQDGFTGTLTATGKAAFPYLKGPIPIPDDDPAVDEAFGYVGTPTNPANWETLVTAPGPPSTPAGAYLGIYTHPDDGREEMVMTVTSNQYQTHNQALRHGMLTWVTRGVFLGYQRTYLGLDIDDIFLPDDKWDPVNNVTDYSPESAIRMTANDVRNAVAWQQRSGVKMNMVYNMGGVAEFGVPSGTNDALLAEFRLNKNAFRWVNHTLQHPNLDCTTFSYTRDQLRDNQTLFNGLLGSNPPLNPGLNDPSEAITGEHSGLANVRPGNPGTIDPPHLNGLVPVAGGTLAGTYDYAITARNAAGETVASIAQVTLAAPSAVEATFNSVCHATSIRVYRRQAPAGAWSLIHTVARAERDPVDDGEDPIEHTFTDLGAAGTPEAPPAANGATLAPYAQNPFYTAALTAANITTVATDSSKGYPNPPDKSPVSDADPTNFPKGATFPVTPTIQAVPRYPSNVYYNVASRADQLDEYNWIYTSPPIGACVPIPNVTTCNAAEVTWQQYLASETRIMFGHLMGNDPRPHYFHQTNIAQSDLTKAPTDISPGVGGTLYAVIDTLLARYDLMFDRGLVPLVQLSQKDVAGTLVQQNAWLANRGAVSAWLQDGTVHIANGGTAAVAVPVTGTTAGTPYGGQRSGWLNLAPGSEQVLEPADPAKATEPAVSGAAKVGQTLTATGGTWTSTSPIVRRHRWQRCKATRCTTIPGATGTTYDVTVADVGSSLRVVVSAGNWISSVGLGVSPRTGEVPEVPVDAKGNKPAGSGPQGGGGPGAQGGKKLRNGKKLALTRVRMSPRRFPVAHRRPKKGTRLDGSTITWRLNRSATVRLKFQRSRGKGAQRRWVKVGTIKRASKAGKDVVRFRGRFGAKLLAPGRYRLVVTAKQGKQRSGPARVRFKVVRG